MVFEASSTDLEHAGVPIGRNLADRWRKPLDAPSSGRPLPIKDLYFDSPYSHILRGDIGYHASN